MDIQKDLNDIKLQVGLLEKDIKMADRQCERVSANINEGVKNIQECNANLVKIITIHEQKHGQHDKAETILSDEVKELHSRITAVNKDMQDRMDNVEDNILGKIDDLRKDLFNQSMTDKTPEKKKFLDFIAEFDKYKWMVVGGGLVLGWIFGNIGIVHKVVELFTSK